MTEQTAWDISPAALTRAAQIGFAAQAMWQGGLPYSAGWILPQYVTPAIALGQVAFAFNNQNLAEAVLTWAYLSDQVGAELSLNPLRPLHPSEWNEGLNLWILASLGLPRACAQLLDDTLRGPLRGFEQVNGFEQGLDGFPQGLVTGSPQLFSQMFRGR